MSAARTPGRAVPAMRRGAVAALVVAAALVPTATPAAAATPAATSVPMAVSIVVPITADAGPNGLLDAEALETATSPTGDLTRELDELLATSATIALDPMIAASIRVLGSAAPVSARDWLARLDEAPNEVFLLAYADADPTPLVRADALDLATPSGFDFAIDPDAFGPAATPEPTEAPTATPDPSGTPTPTETTDPGEGDPPPLPTTAELLAWSDALPGIAWPSADSVAVDDLPFYLDAGYTSVLLSSGNVSETSGALASIGDLRAIVADSAASDLLAEASSSVDDATREQAITRLGAALDGLAAAHPGRSVVLTLDRRSAFAFYGLEETYRTIETRASTRMVGLSDVLAGTAESAKIVDRGAGDSVALAPALTSALQDEEEFASILTDPALLTQPRHLELLALLGVQRTADEEWRADADAFLARSAEILESVAIVDTGRVFVTSSQTSIPIRISNALDFPVTVQVDARALRPLLQIDSPAELTVEPGSSKIVRLDAQAITNGEVVVEVRLSSPSTGTAIGRPQRFEADLQAQWETVGIIVGAALALVFAVGIARNVVIRRRRAAAERGPGEQAPE